MKWNLLAPNLKTSYFQRELGKAEKQAQKLALKTFLVSHDFFAMFTSVKHKNEAKNKTQRCNIMNN